MLINKSSIVETCEAWGVWACVLYYFHTEDGIISGQIILYYIIYKLGVRIHIDISHESRKWYLFNKLILGLGPLPIMLMRNWCQIKQMVGALVNSYLR